MTLFNPSMKLQNARAHAQFLELQPSGKIVAGIIGVSIGFS